MLLPLGIHHINFFSLDVEGGELLVLQSIDFSALSFDALCVEADGSNQEKDQGVRDILAANGYKYVIIVDPASACGGVVQVEFTGRLEVEVQN